MLSSWEMPSSTVMFSRQIKLSIILTAIRRVDRSLRFSRCSSIISKIWCLLIMLRIKRTKMSSQNSWICVMFGACVIIRQEWETIMVWRWCRSSTSLGRWMPSRRVSITQILLLESWWENSFSSSFIDAFSPPLDCFLLGQRSSKSQFFSWWVFWDLGLFCFWIFLVSFDFRFGFWRNPWGRREGIFSLFYWDIVVLAWDFGTVFCPSIRSICRFLWATVQDFKPK